MESIIESKSFILPGTGSKIEIQYPIDIKTLDEKRFLELCNKPIGINECSENVWYSQFLSKFGIEFQQYKPSDYTWKQYYLWLNNWLNMDITLEQINQENREDLKLLLKKFKSDVTILHNKSSVNKFIQFGNPSLSERLSNVNENVIDRVAVLGHVDVRQWF